MCGETGDVIALESELFGGGFGAAMDRLKALCGGIEPANGEPERQALAQSRMITREIERRAAEERARVIWARLSRSNEVGLAYLARRGLGSVAHYCRFGKRAVCVALWDHTGRVVNVVGRYFDHAPGYPKVRGLKGCGPWGSFGDVRRIGEGPIVLCEGLTDWLSALVLWPGRVVVGAHGAHQMPFVARMIGIANRMYAHRAGVLLVPDNDPAGAKAAKRTETTLATYGIPVTRMTVATDLNDALTQGECTNEPG